MLDWIVIQSFWCRNRRRIYRI